MSAVRIRATLWTSCLVHVRSMLRSAVTCKLAARQISLFVAAACLHGAVELLQALFTLQLSLYRNMIQCHCHCTVILSYCHTVIVKASCYNSYVGIVEGIT